MTPARGNFGPLFRFDRTAFGLIPVLIGQRVGELELADATPATQCGISTGQIKGQTRRENVWKNLGCQGERKETELTVWPLTLTLSDTSVPHFFHYPLRSLPHPASHHTCSHSIKLLCVCLTLLIQRSPPLSFHSLTPTSLCSRGLRGLPIHGSRSIIQKRIPFEIPLACSNTFIVCCSPSQLVLVAENKMQGKIAYT